MINQTINLTSQEIVKIELSGQSLGVLFQGLGELPHKIAHPVHVELMSAITAAKEKKEDGAG